MSDQQARFWSRVLAAADAAESGELEADDVVGLLLGLEEGFAGLQDPVESFEAYTVLRLCRSFRTVLERGKSF